MHVLNKRKGKLSKGRNPLCLVLSPTRELAQQVCFYSISLQFLVFLSLFKLICCLQISDVLCDAGRPSGVQSVCLYGGTSKRPQISSLKAGVVRFPHLFFTFLLFDG